MLGQMRRKLLVLRWLYTGRTIGFHVEVKNDNCWTDNRSQRYPSGYVPKGVILLQLVLAPLVALFTVLILTPRVRRLAFRVGALDNPDHRKVHQGVMPRLGGLAIYASFVLAVLLSEHMTWQLWGLLAGATVVVAVGILDDIYRLPPRIKLAGQVLAAVVVIFFGIKMTFVGNPFAPGVVIPLGVLSAPLTVIWVVVVTNAVNLIDGLDGLASGTSFISALTMAAVVALEGHRAPLSANLVVVSLALTIAAATLGFLKYNFHPARIFLGDGGSMLLGFLLASVAVMGLAKSATLVSVVIPPMILGVPLLDTVLAIIRRYRRRLPIMQPDREHMHHRLLNLGLNHRQAVLAIYGVDAVLGLCAVVLTMISPGSALILVEGLVLAVMVIANLPIITGERRLTSYVIPGVIVLLGVSIFLFSWINLPAWSR